MIDRIFAPFLTFALLIGGTAAVASSLFTEQAAPAPQVAQSAACLLYTSDAADE